MGERKENSVNCVDKGLPKVSIGMPVRNMKDTVREAIDGILNQTYPNFELIISDNQSDDGTEEICKAAAEQNPRVTYNRNSKDISGENFRMSFLLTQESKYFMWAAADDSRRPEMIARCVETLEANPEAVLAYPYTELIDSETGTKYLYYDKYRLDQDDPGDRYTSLVRSLNLGNMIYGVYRRDLLYSIPLLNRRSSRFIPFSDAVFLTNIVLKGKVIQIPEVLFIRRRAKSKPWDENLSYLEKRLFPKNLPKTVTLPVSEGIQEHIRYLLASDLPADKKLQLMDVTYEAYIKRYGKYLKIEIDRAVQLAKEGRFMETWNGMPDPHPDEAVQNLMDQTYAGFLLDSLERTGRYLKEYQAIHLGKVFCLYKLGRTQEAEIELEIAKKLEHRK